MAKTKDYRNLSFGETVYKKLLNMDKNIIDKLIRIWVEKGGDPNLVAENARNYDEKPTTKTFKDIAQELRNKFTSPEVHEFNKLSIQISDLEEKLANDSATLAKLSLDTKSAEYQKTLKSIQATSMSLSSLSLKVDSLKKVIKNQPSPESYITQLETKLKNLCK